MPQQGKDRRVGESAGSANRRPGAERRQYQRILVDLEVDYQCEDTFLFAYNTDLSALGIFIRTNNPEPPGTHLNLRFNPPGADGPLELEGEVIWVNPFRPGSFENIPSSRRWEAYHHFNRVGHGGLYQDCNDHLC